MGRRQFGVLYRDFLRRLIDIDVLSVHAQGDASTLYGQFAALLVFLSLLFSVPALYFSGKMRMPGQEFVVVIWSIEHFLIATTMLLVGLFAVLTWNSTFPDKREVMALAPLPVRTRTVFQAKVAAVGTGLALLVGVLHVLGGFVWPLALNRHVAAQRIPDFTSQAAMPPVDAAEMQSVMDRDFEPLEKSGVFKRAGVSIGVVRHGARSVFSYGQAKPDSIFEIASVTKTFTALALARMAERGLVRLDEPVRELLPPETVAKPEGREITLLDLATHHSGLPRMPAGFRPENRKDPFANYHRSDLYEYIARRGVSRPANATLLYSNLGAGLLGQVLADRANTSYADLVKEEITDAIGLKDTVVNLSREQHGRSIQGYFGVTDGPDGFRSGPYAYGDPVEPWHFDALAGAGALHSTATDMLTYLEANLHPRRNGGVLASALLETQKVRDRVDDSAMDAAVLPGGRIGLIWLRTADGCYLHDGASLGQTAFVFFDPGKERAGVVLSNGFLFASFIGLHLRQRLEGLPAISLAEARIPKSGGFARLVRLFVAYWLAMLAAGAFVFGGILALQGVAAQMLPRRWFLRLSSILQLCVFCLVVAVYFLQPPVAAPNPFDIRNAGLPSWSPSYWFWDCFSNWTARAHSRRLPQERGSGWALPLL